MRSPDVNALGQPIGAALPLWIPPTLPPRDLMQGRYCRLEPIDQRFAADLHAANLRDMEGWNWTYLPYGPFSSESDYRRWLTTTCFGTDPLFYVIIDVSSGRAVGVAAYMRIEPQVGSIEVGHVHFSPLLQRVRGATDFFFQAVDGIRDLTVTGVQTCALPISDGAALVEVQYEALPAVQDLLAAITA